MNTVIDKVEAKLPTKYGTFKIVTFETADNLHHVALILGDVKDKKDVLVRVHSECLTGEVFNSLRCDCKDQLNAALKQISKKGSGVLLYLRQEGRGIGLFNKIKAYALQDQGMDTVEANEKLGLKADARDYSLGAELLKEIGVTSIRLMTNNPKKINALKEFGITISGREPLLIKSTEHTKKYLDTKQKKLGHMIEAQN